MLEFAYIDAGTGSLILQAAVAGAAAAGVAFKFYGRRLLVFLRIRKRHPAEADAEAPES